MTTRYLTLILRLRLDNKNSQDSAAYQVSGSVQQVGLQEIVYFDSVEKFQETLQAMVARLTLTEVKYGNSD